MAYASPMKIANGLVLDFPVDNADTAADTFLGLNASGEVTQFASVPRARVSGGGNITEATSSVLSITGGTAAVLTSGLTIQVLQAGAAQSGYLSTTDWNTFNNKLSGSLTSAYIYVGNGSNVATGVAMSGDISITNTGNAQIVAGAIVNADINASAAIAVSKLEALTASRVLGSNGSGVIQALDTATYPSLTELSYVKGVTIAIQTQLNNRLSVTLSSPTNGDVITYNGAAWVNSPSSTGVPTAGTTAQILRKIDNTNYNTEWHTLVAADITDVSSTAAELNKLSGVTTTATQFNFLNTLSGDVQAQLAAKLSTSLTLNNLWVGDASNVAVQLAAGTNGYVLTSVSGVPTWVSPGVGGTVTSVAASGGTTGMSFTGSPITTSGTLTLTGTLAIANGGTGLTALGTAGQLIKVNAGATALEYFTPTYISSVGTGVANELTYWSGTSTLGSLATATYPSLTELSYVKGVTSSIQTQLGTKWSLASGGALTGNNSITGTDKTFSIALDNPSLTGDDISITSADVTNSILRGIKYSDTYAKLFYEDPTGWISNNAFGLVRADDNGLTISGHTFGTNNEFSGDGATAYFGQDPIGGLRGFYLYKYSGGSATAIISVPHSGTAEFNGNAATVTTNANLTGEVTSTGNAAVLNKTAITGKTLVTAAGSDHVLIADASDSDNLKKVLVSDLTGGGISGLTTNELVYGNSATTIASLAVATYPSLTELSYVKGLTSSAQTQITARELLTNKATTLSTMNDTLYPTVDALFQSREVTGADAIVQADNGGVIYFNSGTPFNFTIDALTAKTQVMFINIGAGAVTFINGSGVTFTGTSSLAGGGNESAAIVYHTSTAPIILGSAGGGSGLTVGTSTITSGTNTRVLYNNSGVLGEYTVSGSGNVAMTISPVFTTPDIGTATGTASGNWSLATGGTLTGVNTITSNAFSQLIFTGTATAGSAGLSFINFGGTVTAYNGTGVNIYAKVNPVFNGNGSGNTNIVAQFSHTGSGGTSPNYVDLMVGDFTAATGYLFQAQTGYYSGNFRFDSNIRDNRDNNIVTQSGSGTSSNRTLTIGNTSYAIIDLSNKGVVSFTQSALASVAPTNAFKITGGAHTTLTATSELNDILWSLDRTVQSATGTVANQRYVYIGNPTHGFVGASTSTREVTVAVKGAPIAGTNAAFTRSIGFEVESANVGSGVTNSYAAYFNNQTGATNNNGIGISGSISSTNNYFTINANALATVNSGLLFDFTVDAVFNIKGFTGLSGSTTGNTVRLTGGDGYSSGNTNAGSASITSGVPFGSGTEGSVDIQTRSTGKLGFFNGGGVVKQSVNTILVNNVTSGGTLSTIADYSDLTIYANDAAAIRNNLYRLSEKVLALETALRAYTLIGN